MELRQLRYVIAIAEQGNFARAAAQHGVTQSALTQSVARLELELGVRLFERGRFGATATEAAHALIAHGQAMLSEERLALRDIEAIKGAASGDITIGVGKSVVHHLVPTAIARLTRRKPDVVVTAYEGWSTDLYLRLLKGELDFVVSAAVPQLAVDAELTQDFLFMQHEVVVMSADHPIAVQSEVGLADLTNAHWIVPPFGSGRVRHLQDVFREAGLPPPTRFTRTDSVAILMAMIRARTGIGWATLELMDKESLIGLRSLSLPQLSEARRACITYRRRSRPGPLAAMLAREIKRIAEPIRLETALPSDAIHRLAS